MATSLLTAAVLLLPLLFHVSAASSPPPLLGVNYGQLGSHLPSPAAAVRQILSLGANAVKLYDANPAILSALAGSNLHVSVMLPNHLIPLAAANQSFADAWVSSYLAPFRRSVDLRFLLVGNELFSDPSLRTGTWPALVPALNRLRRALSTHSLRHVKLGTPTAMDVLSASFPPSSGTFNDVAVHVIRPLVRFLRHTRSFFFLDAYPYFPWSASPGAIALDYALMEPTARPYTDPGSGLVYTNLLDQQLDAVAAAMARLGFDDVPIALAETGWPGSGDYDQPGANPRNAAVYNRNLVRRVRSRLGTPARPGLVVPTFIFSLFNEDQKPGPGTERHWGLLYPNGTRVYDLDGPLPAAADNGPYNGPIWCVAAPGAERNGTELAAAVGYACGQLPAGACGPIRAGGSCYKAGPLTASQASFAFNLYWQRFRRSGGTCYFNRLAVQSVTDPSTGSCKLSAE